MSTSIGSSSVSVQQFLAFAPNGSVDMKRTLKSFEDYVRAQLKAHEELKPTILSELQQYKRIGEQALVMFTLHALKLPTSSDNIDKIKAAIKSLEESGQIVYNTNESGTRKGKNAGWMLAGDVSAT